MDEADILAARSKDSRVLIISNLLNGVPEWQVARDFHMESGEINALFAFVMKKVKSYLFRHCKPPIACDTLAEAQKNRFNILAILPKLNLDKEAEYRDIISETVTAANCKSAIHDSLRAS